MLKNKTLHGIDISKWQGKIDFYRVRHAGIQIVYIKATQGDNYIDPDFERNYRDAEKEGLAIGFYHYMTACTTAEARSEAHFFASHIKGKLQHVRPVMDFEDFKDLTKSEIQESALQFLITLENETGHRPAIYSDAYNASRIFANERLREYPLWIADYGVDRPDMENPWHRWSIPLRRATEYDPKPLKRRWRPLENHLKYFSVSMRLESYLFLHNDI